MVEDISFSRHHHRHAYAWSRDERRRVRQQTVWHRTTIWPRQSSIGAFLLSPGYSEASTTVLRLGFYKLRAVFRSDSIDSGSFYIPLMNHPEELEKFRSQKWKRNIASNELTIRMLLPMEKICALVAIVTIR